MTNPARVPLVAGRACFIVESEKEFSGRPYPAFWVATFPSCEWFAVSDSARMCDFAHGTPFASLLRMIRNRLAYRERFAIAITLLRTIRKRLMRAIRKSAMLLFRIFGAILPRTGFFRYTSLPHGSGWRETPMPWEL